MPPLSAVRHSLSIGKHGSAVSAYFMIGTGFGCLAFNTRSATTFEVVIRSAASQMLHMRQTIMEPSACRSRSTACWVEPRHSRVYVAVTVPTDSGDAATADNGAVCRVEIFAKPPCCGHSLSPSLTSSALVDV